MVGERGDAAVATRSSGTPRSRRSGEEIRWRLVRAGREVFAERGFAGASTKEIAQRAEVTEVLLFRHYGNKAGLFNEAILEPFERFVEDWADRWSRHGLEGKSVEVVATEYVELLYGFFEENRQLMLALFTQSPRHPSTDDRLEKLFARLEHTVREAAAEFALPSRDPLMTVRLTFGLVLSAAVHADILFPAKSAPSREHLIGELTHYLLDGISRLR
jgi:AcrR family transcriptional regulator